MKFSELYLEVKIIRQEWDKASRKKVSRTLKKEYAKHMRTFPLRIKEALNKYLTSFFLAHPGVEVVEFAYGHLSINKEWLSTEEYKRKVFLIEYDLKAETLEELEWVYYSLLSRSKDTFKRENYIEAGGVKV